MLNINKGDDVKFSSKALNDPNVYTGKVIGIVDYDVAKWFGGIETTHANVRSADNTIPEDIKELNFYIVMNEEEQFAFADEWIKTDSLEVVSSIMTGVFTVVGLTSQADADNLRDLILAQGYSARIDSLT